MYIVCKGGSPLHVAFANCTLLSTLCYNLMYTNVHDIVHVCIRPAAHRGHSRFKMNDQHVMLPRPRPVAHFLELYSASILALASTGQIFVKYNATSLPHQ